MSSTTRHAARGNLRRAENDEEAGRPSMEGRAPFRRPSLRSLKQSRPTRTLKRSDTVLAALSDPESELTKFLKADEASSLGTNRAWFYSLALEPMEIRKERIIIMAEAYAIFGALFLNGTWFLYEFGGVESGSVVVDRMFGAAMALALVSNMFMAMFSSFLWLMSVLFSGSCRNWVYGARDLLLFCHILLVCILLFTTLGVGLGLYANLRGRWPELAICEAFFLTVVVVGMHHVAMLVGKEIPLEYHHFPLWFKLAIMPFPLLTRSGRQEIRNGAKIRADELKARAFRERTMLDPKGSIASVKKRGSIYSLLRSAADSIGREDFDITQYESNLEKDWYSEEEQLRRLSVDTLSRYMPRHLAEEVHKELEKSTSHDNPNRTGDKSVAGYDDAKGRGLSWKLDDDGGGGGDTYSNHS